MELLPHMQTPKESCKKVLVKTCAPYAHPKGHNKIYCYYHHVEVLSVPLPCHRLASPLTRRCFRARHVGSC